MLEVASQMILCLLLAALIGAIIGYLFGKSTCASDDCDHSSTETEKVAVHAAAVEEPQDEIPEETEVTSSEEDEDKDEEDEPALLTGPRNGEKDNLTRIKGIGLKIEEALNKIGIYHFDQIAAWTEENIAWADSTLGFPGRANREKWVEQAKALAAGEETEFSKRVDAGEVATSKKA